MVILGHFWLNYFFIIDDYLIIISSKLFWLFDDYSFSIIRNYLMIISSPRQQQVGRQASFPKAFALHRGTSFGLVQNFFKAAIHNDGFFVLGFSSSVFRRPRSRRQPRRRPGLPFPSEDRWPILQHQIQHSGLSVETINPSGGVVTFSEVVSSAAFACVWSSAIQPTNLLMSASEIGHLK